MSSNGDSRKRRAECEQVPTQSDAATSSSIYNLDSARVEKPAELFRKDLISNMKLADSDYLAPSEYLLVTDQWRQDWEKGVQVPVDLGSVPEPEWEEVTTRATPFSVPNHLINVGITQNFDPSIHVDCSYLLQKDNIMYVADELDLAWLHLLNRLLVASAQRELLLDIFELVMKRFETCCNERLSEAIRTQEGLGVEYDEEAACDVCRHTDAEEDNEMVFCDRCDLCVHQACYGILEIPSGEWLCRPCALSITPLCSLCGKKSGAMKSTKNGTRWCHLNCSIWIPEVMIGDTDRMEPITGLAQIPEDRWSLTCSICREKTGACIQCSVKQCKVAHHVTCSFDAGNVMKQELDDNGGDVTLYNYCTKHSATIRLTEPSPSKRKLNSTPLSSPRKPPKGDIQNVRLARLANLERNFYKNVTAADALDILGDRQQLSAVFEYWKLKRKNGRDVPLLPLDKGNGPQLATQDEKQRQVLDRMRLFIHVRQDLERVRNLAYMLCKREKQKRQLIVTRLSLFHRASRLMKATGSAESGRILAAVTDNPPYGPTRSAVHPKVAGLIAETRLKFNSDLKDSPRRDAHSTSRSKRIKIPTK